MTVFREKAGRDAKPSIAMVVTLLQSQAGHLSEFSEENRRELLLAPKHNPRDINNEEFQVVIAAVPLFASKEMWKSNKLLVQQL